MHGRVASLLRAAKRRTGLNDWGDSEFLTRLSVWLQAAADDRGLSDLGRQSVDTFALRYACNRLRLEHLITEHPEIEDVALPRPIVVTGLPRSGTTALAKLLSGSGTRWLPYWEAVEPFSSIGDVRARRLRAARECVEAQRLVPGLCRYHPMTAESFTDDQELQGLAFGSYMLEWQAHVPAWRDYTLSEDQTGVYRYLRRALQALTWLRGPDRWVIKCPQHMEHLPALAAAFPDALLVVTERRRAEADRSMRGLTGSIGLQMRTRPIPLNYWPSRFDVMSARYSEHRHLFPDRIEVKSEEWATNALAFRQRVHDAANLQRDGLHS